MLYIKELNVLSTDLKTHVDKSIHTCFYVDNLFTTMWMLVLWKTIFTQKIRQIF